MEELRRGELAARADCLALIADLPILAVEPPILQIVQSYIARHVMPADPVGDALHLALASYHRCDFLVTWNCKHLANANKFGQIRRVNGLLGLFTPALVTPLEMKTDQGIEAVRKARSEISRELGNDPARLIAHYLELQKGFSGRLLLGPEGDAAAEPADAPFLAAPGSAVHV